jgi:hypothetical protein
MKMDSQLKHAVKHNECLKEINSFVVTLGSCFYTSHIITVGYSK